MTLKQLLEQGREILAAANVESTSLESELLLRHVLQMDRVKLFLNIDKELDLSEEKAFWKLVERRLSGEPTAYIMQKREFYGLEFYVDNRVLIPRPESELLVEKALDFANRHTVSAIADIGTGSGAIAVSLAVNLNIRPVRIYATDISSSALEVAAINCNRYGVSGKVTLLHGDLLSVLPEPVDLIIANLPYVSQSELSGIPSARFEPLLALDGGIDGLEKIYQLCRQVEQKIKPGGCLFLEIGLGQVESVENYLQDLFPLAGIEVSPDLGDIERVVALHLNH